MSTRAVYTFIDDDGRSYPVYKHHDGYPSGAAAHIRAALPYAWPLPRFEASEFAAAFVAGNKALPDPKYPDSQGGGVYLTAGRSAHGDLEYAYEISFKEDYGLQVRCLAARWDGAYLFEEKFCGSLDSFCAWTGMTS